MNLGAAILNLKNITIKDSVLTDAILFTVSSNVQVLTLRQLYIDSAILNGSLGVSTLLNSTSQKSDYY
jgi:hypothetical protein